MQRPPGFSLVEVIAAMAVFAVLGVILVRMVGSVSSVITGASKSLDADSEARVIFSLLDRDFAGMVNRRDVDAIFRKVNLTSTSTGNDEIYFFSAAPATDPFGSATELNPISLVGYRVGSVPGNPIALQLQRLGLGLAWTTFSSSGGNPARDNLPFLTWPAGAGVPDAMSTIVGRWGAGSDRVIDPTDPAVIETVWSAGGPQAFRFEVCFLLRDGTFSNFPVQNNSGSSPAHASPPSATSTDPIGTRWFDSSSSSNASAGRGYIREPVGWRSAGLTDVTGIVVSLGILDQESRKLTPDTAGLARLLPDVAQTDLGPPNLAKLPRENWQTRINDPGFAAGASLPPQVASHIKVYERCFYLNRRNE